MAKVKLRELIDNSFLLALSDVCKQELSALQSWSLVKLQNKINEHILEYDKARNVSLKKFANLKEDGSFESDDKGQIEFKSDADKVSAIKEVEELLNQEVEVPDIKLSAIANLKVDALSMQYLQKVVSE
jgi:hypothetical protein